ncbi:Helix-destabilizing protein [Oligella urethralis]|uniref:single-stranded DNA-binding protein n=1 Tax=Oligella urethralis TaxID=90245 RepID=UPI000E04AF8C|nr:single-stranded DNA-binding protein [Oligella urethralis]SUA61612.1 Helix-destabilizing protein [Oligella urethralis]
MSFINEVTVMGNIGGDPKLKEHANGTISCSLSLATNDGQRVTWHKVQIWGKLAHVVCKHMIKGDKLWVRGAIVSRTFKKDDEALQTVTEIKAKSIKIIYAKKLHNQNKKDLSEKQITA